MTRLNVWPVPLALYPLLNLLRFTIFTLYIGEPVSGSGPVLRSRAHSRRHSDENSVSSRNANLPTSVPTDTREDTPQDPLYALLAQLTDRVSQPRSSSARNVRVEPPSPFSGTDRTRLRSFINKLESIFLAQPESFPTDKDKITYTGTCLADTAHSWYTARAIPGHHLYDSEFTSSWPIFVNDLRTQFGSRDEEDLAATRLRNIRMESHHQCAVYITRFEEINDILQWPDRPLMDAFRRGLPDRILDVLANRERKPDTLKRLQDAALDIDVRYWENQEFKRVRNPGKSDSANSNRSPVNTRTPAANESHPATNQSPSNSSRPAHLTASNQLTSEERTRRMRAGLCLFCGKSGHLLQNCEERKQREASRISAQSRATVADAQAPVPSNHSENY